MNKEEYAMLHYLLAKVKYDLSKDLVTMSNKKARDKNTTLINDINEIEKLCMVDDENENYNVC